MGGYAVTLTLLGLVCIALDMEWTNHECTFERVLCTKEVDMYPIYREI